MPRRARASADAAHVADSTCRAPERQARLAPDIGLGNTDVFAHASIETRERLARLRTFMPAYDCVPRTTQKAAGQLWYRDALE